jgi:predicted PurR-regulated permease PerM
MNQTTVSEPAPPVAPSENASSPGPTAFWGPVHLLAVIVFVAAAWLGRELLVPVMVGLFLALIANPLVTRLTRWRVPRWIGAFFVVFGGFALAVALASQLVAPTAQWMQKAPQELRQVAPKLKALVRKVDDANKAAQSIVSAAGAQGGETRAARAAAAAAAAQDKPKPPSMWTLIRAAPGVLAVIGAVILLAYFFVVYGVGLQRNIIARLPERRQKKLTTEILQTIETELSQYVLTITLINMVLAALLTLALWLLGLEIGDALLWGAIGGILNFAPYVGPVIGVIALSLVGVVAFDQPGQIILPPLVYLGLQMLESEVVTPIILGRRWSISPLVVLLWLLFCGWLWGIAGVLLAVPMLVSFKIVAERVEGLHGWSKVIA